MGKQTIESKIRGALARATREHPDSDVVISASAISDRTSLTVGQVTRFGRSKRSSLSIGGRQVRYASCDFTVGPPPPPPEPRRPSSPQPDWFAPPVGVIERERGSWRTGSNRKLTRQICEGLRRGAFVLPPWQRGSVWTESQQVSLLDSMMRGVSIGAITLWEPSHDEDTEGSSFDGCPFADRTSFVIDGQQRLTTFLRAGTGDLDHWRWNGLEWTTGPGFLVPSQMVGRLAHHWPPMDWAGWAISKTDDEFGVMCNALDTLENFAVTFMTISGSVDHMVEVYRRLATFGSPHSVEDLAHMDRWLAAQ